MIEEVIVKYEAKIFCADPVQAYMNMYRLETVRETLVSLGKVAERTGCAILLIGHLTKSQTKAQYRGLGSQDIYNSIPNALNLAKIDDNDDVRVLLRNKCNFFEIATPISFALKNGLNWIGEYDITLDELLAGGITPQRDRQRQRAKDFLIDLFEGGGEVSSTKVYDLADKQSIARRTLARAKSELGIISVQKADGWVWVMND